MRIWPFLTWGQTTAEVVATDSTSASLTNFLNAAEVVEELACSTFRSKCWRRPGPLRTSTKSARARENCASLISPASCWKNESSVRTNAVAHSSQNYLRFISSGVGIPPFPMIASVCIARQRLSHLCGTLFALCVIGHDDANKIDCVATRLSQVRTESAAVSSHDMW